ncbi:MAG TPA: site-specific integrase [Longimicrobium sp.]|nr:site-specific integrase [Longimicrobium sp.]
MTEPERVHVRSGPSTVGGDGNRTAFSLWRGELPIVPATAWLAHIHRNAGLAEATREGYAYGLLCFFTYLASEKIDFWELDGSHILGFRSYLNGEALKRTTAAQYLSAVSQMLGWLISPEVKREFFPKRERGSRQRGAGKGFMAKLKKDGHAQDDLFTIRIRNRRNTYRKHGLPPELQQRVWDALEGAYPTRAAVLRKNGRATSPEARRRAQNAFDVRKMLWYRNRAIWALLHMGAPRKGELLRIAEADIGGEDNVIPIVDRPEHRHLGELKLGERLIWFPRHHPYMRFVDEWLLYGRPIAVKLLRAAGLPDHGLLFCSNHGGPLTKHGIHHLFDSLAEKLGLDRRTRPFSCHVARHTGATMLKRAGANPGVIQAYLGHSSVTSQDNYTGLDEATVREFLTQAWEKGPVILPSQPER